jgi:hypothetical protein
MRIGCGASVMGVRLLPGVGVAFPKSGVGGGMGELGVGRGQIELLAALFHADAPNDVAPSAYNEDDAGSRSTARTYRLTTGIATPDAYDNADWSPDGSKLVFQTYYDSQLGKSPNLFTIRPDGGKMTALTHFTGGDIQALGPSWSPDGTKIVWHKLSPTIDQLFVMDANGRHARRLTRLPAGSTPSRADWGTAAG